MFENEQKRLAAEPAVIGTSLDDELFGGPENTGGLDAMIESKTYVEDGVMYWRATGAQLTDTELDNLVTMYRAAHGIESPAPTTPSQNPNIRITTNGTADSDPTHLSIEVTRTVVYDAKVSDPRLMGAAALHIHDSMNRDAALAAAPATQATGTRSETYMPAKRVKGKGNRQRDNDQDIIDADVVGEESISDERTSRKDKKAAKEQATKRPERSKNFHRAVGGAVLIGAIFFTESAQTWLYQTVAGDSSNGASYWSKKANDETKRIPLIGGMYARFVPHISSGEEKK